MARNRTTRNNPTDDNTNKESTKMANALSAEQISALLSSSKQRGEYDRELKAFMESGEAGIEVSLETGNFAGKKSSSVKTGFTNAAKREGAPEGADQVAVIVNEDHVYLVRRDLVGQ